jgi:hypothetical protein
MLALIPVIGPMLSVQTIAGWEITKTVIAMYEAMNPYAAFAALFGNATIYPWVNLAVWALAF